MSKKTNNLTYLLMALFVCVFPVLHFPKMLQVTTLPKFVFMITVALALLIVSKNRKSNKDELIVFLPVFIFALWALMFSWSDVTGGNFIALFGVDSGGLGIILLFCAAIFFRSGRSLSLDSISRKNFLWFYTIGINLSLLIWLFSDRFKDIAAGIDLIYLEFEHTSTFINQPTFLIFAASLAPIIFSLMFIEKNKLLRVFAAMIFVVDMLALSRLFAQSGDGTFFYLLTFLGVAVACAGLLDPRRRPIKNAYLKLCGVLIGIAIIVPIAGGIVGLTAGSGADNKFISNEKSKILANALDSTSVSAPELSSYNALMALTHSSPVDVLLGNGIGEFQQVFFASVRNGTIQGNFNNFPVTAPTFALEVIAIFGLAGFMILLLAALYFIKIIVSHNTATLFFYAISASAMIFTLSMFYVPMNFQSLIIALLLVGISMGQRPSVHAIGQKRDATKEGATNEANEAHFQKNTGPAPQSDGLPSDGIQRSQMQHHRLMQKVKTISVIIMTAILLAYSTLLTVQDLKSELAYLKASKNDDMQKIREISIASTQYGAVEKAAAKYLIFEGFALKDTMIQAEGFALLERLQEKNPQELNILNEVTSNAFLVNDLELAIESLTTMSELNTSSANIYNGIGYAYFKKGDLASALVHYQKALFINDTSPITYVLIRDVYLNLGDKSMAEKFDKKGALLK